MYAYTFRTMIPRYALDNTSHTFYQATRKYCFSVMFQHFRQVFQGGVIFRVKCFLDIEILENPLLYVMYILLYK